MDLQMFMNNAMKARRSQVLSRSNQLTLGELILKLKPIVEKNADEPEQPRVVFDFGTAFPTSLASWRGSYEELALGYALSGYDASTNHFGEIKADALLNELESALQKTYTGWKGGEFSMHKGTPVWVANPGNSGNTAIVEVVDNGWEVILMTQYCEY